MAMDFDRRIERSPPQDLSDLLGLSPREAEVMYYQIRDYDDSEIAEEMGIEESTVASFKSKINRKGDRAKTTLRALTETGIYSPKDVNIDFSRIEDTVDERLKSEELDAYLSELLSQEEDLVQELQEFARELSRMVNSRRNNLIRLKRDLSTRGVIDAHAWELMDRGERMGWVLDTIDIMVDELEAPVSQSDLIQRLLRETNASENEITNTLDRLFERGEIYMPEESRYRTTRPNR